MQFARFNGIKIGFYIIEQNIVLIIVLIFRLFLMIKQHPVEYKP